MERRIIAFVRDLTHPRARGMAIFLWFRNIFDSFWSHALVESLVFFGFACGVVLFSNGVARSWFISVVNPRQIICAWCSIFLFFFAMFSVDLNSLPSSDLLFSNGCSMVLHCFLMVLQVCWPIRIVSPCRIVVSHIISVWLCIASVLFTEFAISVVDWFSIAVVFRPLKAALFFDLGPCSIFKGPLPLVLWEFAL